MKYSPILSLIVCLMVVDIQVETKEIKFHVFPMEGKEEIYYRLKRRAPSVRHPVEEKHRVKEKVCAAILESDFFDSHNVASVDPHHPDVHEKIKQHDPQLFQKHYNHSHHSRDELKFANPYLLKDVVIRGTFIREWVFLCLAKNVKTHSIQQYFVSPMHHTTDGKVVRFVFAYNKRREMVVVAKAEGNSTVHHHQHDKPSEPETTTPTKTTPTTKVVNDARKTTETGKDSEEKEGDYSEDYSEEEESYEDDEEYESETEEEEDDEDEYNDSDEEDEYSDEEKEEKEE